MSIEYEPSDYFCDVDVLIVGTGITGLIAARDCADNGLKNIVIYEAKDRIGGRVWSQTVGEAFHSLANRPGKQGSSAFPIHRQHHQNHQQQLNENRINMTEELAADIVELGAEWFDPINNKFVARELQRYNLEFEKPTLRRCWNLWEGKRLGRDDDPMSTPEDKAELDRVLSIMHDDMDRYRQDQDERRVKKLGGYDVAKFDYLDIPFLDYVEQRLQARGPPKEFLLAQGFIIAGAESHHYSALGLIHELTNLCGRLDNIRSAFHKTLSRIKGGAQQLANAILNDIQNRGVKIFLNTSISSINSVQHPPNPDAPFWRQDLRNPLPIVHVLTADGALVRARGVIVAIPMNILPIVHFSPPIESNITAACVRCNAGKVSKTWILASGVSNLDRIICWPGCIESIVKERRVVPDIILSQSFLITSSAKTTKRINISNTIAEAAYLNNGLGVSTTSEFMGGGSMGSTLGGSALTTKKVCLLSALAIREDVLGEPPSSLVTNQDERVVSQVRDKEAEQALYCKRMTRHLRKHHPTIKVHAVIEHDYSRDRWARGTGFITRSGTRSQHAEACRLALEPWSHAKTLYIAGSDFSMGWSGWVEGAVASGKEVARLVSRNLYKILINMKK